jgi:hypothetical protein
LEILNEVVKMEPGNRNAVRYHQLISLKIEEEAKKKELEIFGLKKEKTENNSFIFDY